ncbi:hypothetical protein ACSQ67_017928 [Phaseolus vulgaris]
MKGPKGFTCPLSSEPELQEINLSEDDNFLIMGCDSLWDVMSNQCAVTMARKELMIHNDPQRFRKDGFCCVYKKLILIIDTEVAGGSCLSIASAAPYI